MVSSDPPSGFLDSALFLAQSAPPCIYIYKEKTKHINTNLQFTCRTWLMYLQMITCMEKTYIQNNMQNTLYADTSQTQKERENTDHTDSISSAHQQFIGTIIFPLNNKHQVEKEKQREKNKWSWKSHCTWLQPNQACKQYTIWRRRSYHHKKKMTTWTTDLE